jgi:hypothetical protein
MKSTYLLLVSLILAFSSVKAQVPVLPDFGETPGLISQSEFTRTVAFGDQIAVLNFFQSADGVTKIFLLDQDGLISQTIPVSTDTSFFDPVLFTDGDTLFLAGYESPKPLRLDSAFFLSRDFVIRSFHPNTGLNELARTSVLPEELGLPFFSRQVGVNTDVVTYRPFSLIGAASTHSLTIIGENQRVISDNAGVPVQSPGFTVLSYFDRNSGTLTRKAAVFPDALRSLADVVALDNATIAYAPKGGNNDFSTIHFLDDSGEISSSTFDADVYTSTALSQYATRASGNTMVEVAGTTTDFQFGVNILGTRITLRDSSRTSLLDGPFINGQAPFGPGSLIMNKEGAVYLATVSVLNDRSSLPIAIHKLMPNTLEIEWSLPLSIDTFGLFESMVPTEDGGLLVFGAAPSGNDFENKVTKIGRSLTNISTQEYRFLRNWILRPNPTKGEILIHEDALRGPEKLHLTGFNAAGQQVFNSPVRSNRINLPASGNGLVLLQLRDERGRIVATRKVMFE